MKASRLYTKKALKVLKMAQKRRLTWCLFAQLFAGLKVRISLSRHPARIGSQFRPCEARNTTNQCATPPVLCTRVRADSNKVTRRRKSRLPQSRQQRLYRKRLVVCDAEEIYYMLNQKARHVGKSSSSSMGTRKLAE